MGEAGFHAQRKPLIAEGDLMESNRQTKRKALGIECPVCGERAHSFRIRRVPDLLIVVGEFYYSTATCAGSMKLGMRDLDLLLLATRPEEETQP